MKRGQSDWYRQSWSLDIKKQSWTENTEKEVSFLIQEMGLCGNERILDLACGYGRHALEFAKRGFQVFEYGHPTRLYHSVEIDSIMRSRGMETIKKYSDYSGTIASENGLQLMVISKKKQW